MSGEPIKITVTRTDYAPGIDNEWQVETESPPHFTHHRDLDSALLMIRVIMEGIERDQVHR
jgi:hypothetical protein